MGAGMGNPEGGVIDISIAGAVVDSLPSSPFLEGFLEARVKYPLMAFILTDSSRIRKQQKICSCCG